MGVREADVGHIRLALHQGLRGAEVADLQRVRVAIHQQVLWLDVPVADAHGMDIRA